MVKITCNNPKCSAKSFLWNELSELGSPHDLAEPNTMDAVRLVVSCPYCSTDNLIWVKKAGLKKIKVNRGQDK